jgi:insulysin
MAWPVPRHLLLSAPRLTWAWENEEDRKRGEEKIAAYMDSFRVGNSRVVLMAKKEDHVKLQADLKWGKEPWYGTEYAVQRWDADFVKEVRVIFQW